MGQALALDKGRPWPTGKLATMEGIIERFAEDVALTAEKEPDDFSMQTREEGVAPLVRELVLQLQQQAKAKPQGWVIGGMSINLAFVVTLAFWSGSLWSRVQVLEDRVHQMPQSTDAITLQVSDIKAEVARLRDAIERMDREQQRRTR